MALKTPFRKTKRSPKDASRFYGAKIFLLSFLLTTLLTPAAAFGLVRLGYLALGLDTNRGLDSLLIIGAERQAVVLGVALLLGISLLFGARKIGARTRVPDSAGRRLTPLLLLLLSTPCLLFLDQFIYLQILDNPFPAARHMIMYREGWGLLLFVWQLLFCLGFASGAPKTGKYRDTLGLSGVDRPPPLS